MNNKVSNKRKTDNNIKKIVKCDAPLPKASLYAFLLVTLLSMLLVLFTI